MNEYRVFHDPDLGYCAQIYDEDFRVWEQVSYWYHSLRNLNRYFAQKHGFTFIDTEHHVFI